MNWYENKKQTIASLFTVLFIMTGTYNAIVINSQSHINGEDIKFVKRLDEVFGVTTQGREVANSLQWQKIPKRTAQIQPSFLAQAIQRQEASSSFPSAEPATAEEVVPTAAIQEELNLGLAEVINPKKWPQTLTAAQFSGNLTTNNGSIEDLSVSLPNGEGFSISFIEMSGNVFEYDLSGELYSGMLYQIDQNSYMVSLTNGPLEGTRLRFSPGSSDQGQEQQKVQEQLNTDHNVEVGNFGAEETPANPAAVVQTDQAMQEEALKAQGSEEAPLQAM